MTVSFGGKIFKIIGGEQLQEILSPFIANGEIDTVIDLTAQKELTSLEEKSRFVYGSVSTFLFSQRVPRIHCSAVVYKGVAYAFAAPSGTGKSTHAKLWNTLAKAEYINDDQPFFELAEKITVYPSPWSGKHRKFSTQNAPLGAIVILKQAKDNKIYPIDKKSALSYLYKQIVQLEQLEMRIKMLEYMQEIVEKTPFYMLECNISKEAFITSFEFLTGEKYEN